jgi:hypothetical protein
MGADRLRSAFRAFIYKYIVDLALFLVGGLSCVGKGAFDAILVVVLVPTYYLEGRRAG